MDLETFIEATDLGKLTYEACGFIYAGTNYLETAKRNASPEWKALERDLQYVYLSLYTMSRLVDTVDTCWWCVDVFSNVFHWLDPFANSREAPELAYFGAVLTQSGRLSICIVCGDPRVGGGWKGRHNFPGRSTRKTVRRTNSILKYADLRSSKNTYLFKYSMRLRNQSLEGDTLKAAGGECRLRHLETRRCSTSL